jgi:Bacterial regulatory proteins, gntR family
MALIANCQSLITARPFVALTMGDSLVRFAPAEAALAPEFGVSRTVVREAISRLKHGVLLESGKAAEFL